MTLSARLAAIGLVALVIAACAANVRRSPEPFGEPVLPGTALSTAVNEYFHWRRAAIVRRDPEILWARYPELRLGEDLPTGINTEGWLAVRSDTARSLSEVIFDRDRYDRVQQRTTADGVVVRVHGLERYIQADFSDGTAGEFILDLHLRRDGDGWTVIRTDAMTLGEYHVRK